MRQQNGSVVCAWQSLRNAYRRSSGRGVPSTIVVAALVAALLPLAPRDASALDPGKQLSQFWHRSWTQQHGLPQDSVRAIVQAADGALWLGTDEGLARFDGAEFTIFRQGPGELRSAQVTALEAARDGAIWIGTLAGVACYRNGRFEYYDPAGGLGTHAVTDLHEDRDGTIWAVGGVLVSAIRDGRIVNYGVEHGVPPEGLRVLADAPDGTLLGAGLGEIVRFRDGHFEPVIDSRPLGDAIPLSMTVDDGGAIWIGTTYGVVRVQGKRLQRYGEIDGMPAPVRALLRDRDGTLWAGTSNGVARLVDGRFERVSTPALRLNARVSSLFEDRDGSIWIGTNSGLHRFRDQPFTIYGTPEGLPSDQPTAVHEDAEGALWIGFQDAGVMRLNGGRVERFTAASGLAGDEVFSLYGTRDGSMLVGTRNGLSRIRPDGSITNLAPIDPLNRRSVHDAIEDETGRLLLGTANGVLLVERGRQRHLFGGGPTLADAIVALARDADGTIWAATYDRGLWRYQHGKAERFTREHGLPTDALRALRIDALGVLWIGTAGGGLAWRQGDRFSSVSTPQGLDSGTIGQIIDDDEDLWLGTPSGLLRVKKRSLLDGQVGRTDDSIFAASAGLRSSQCAPGFPVASGGTRDREGRIWAITANGLAMLDPVRLSAPPPPPTPEIRAVLVDGMPVDPRTAFEVAPGTGRVEFQFASVWLGTPERLYYQYRLEGVDPGWIGGGTRRTVDYNNLPPGHYRFLVRASLGDDITSPPAVVTFTRRAAWFEARWFPFAVVAALALLASGLYWLRLRQVRAMFAMRLEERVRIARDLHDTLAQDLVGIGTQLAGVASAMSSAPERAAQQLALARRMTQHSLTEARRAIMDLRTSALDGRGLPAALDHVIREMAAASGVEVVLSADPAADPDDERRQQQLLRIAQEAVANALKHARPTRIDVMLAARNGHTVLRVSDNGAGFSPADAFAVSHGHFGLLGMRERARAVGGELVIQSAPGAGTTVEARVPRP
ncbi:MAG TPA: two-component regulator propeller domain-containing protein [Vicinamibacterales bacterium]